MAIDLQGFSRTLLPPPTNYGSRVHCAAYDGMRRSSGVVARGAPVLGGVTTARTVRRPLWAQRWAMCGLRLGTNASHFAVNPYRRGALYGKTGISSTSSRQTSRPRV